MTDEIRIYHVDDPNDAPDRRLSAFPTLNPFIPTSLPQYVIPPVANSLYTAFQYYWYSAYQQGIAAQKQQQQQQLISNTQDHHNRYHIQQSHHHHPNRNHQVVSPSSSIGLTGSSSSSSSSSASSSTLNIASSTLVGPSSSSSSSSSPVTSTTPSSHHNQHMSEHDHLRGQHHHHSINTSTEHHHNHNHHLHQLHHHNQHERDSTQHQHEHQQQQQQQKHQHIKKPLNPFMIYMQKRRPEIVKRGDIKESAAINQYLGQEWRKMSREEQEPFYKLAEQEKILHAQKYPGWSARDNYANQKKRKKLKIKSRQEDHSDKKCRARFGLCNMASWCKPCRRKKKCIYNQ